MFFYTVVFPEIHRIATYEPRINERIRISPILLIDENGVQVGQIETYKAQQRAQELGIDLVEVNPSSRPPVCKLMDYGKVKYQQKKKQTKSHSHEVKLKEVRLRPVTDEHDIGIKLNNAKRFLEEGDKVQFTMVFKGKRERMHIDMGMDHMRDIASKLSEVARVERPPRPEGRRIVMIMLPGKAPAQGQSAMSSARPAPAMAPRPAMARPAPALTPAAPPAPAAAAAPVAAAAPNN